MDGNVAVFSHGHFGRVLATGWIGLPVSEAEHVQLGTASVGIFGYDPHQPDVVVIERWNEVSAARCQPGNSPAIDRWENEGVEIPHQQTNEMDFESTFGGVKTPWRSDLRTSIFQLHQHFQRDGDWREHLADLCR